MCSLVSLVGATPSITGPPDCGPATSSSAQEDLDPRRWSRVFDFQAEGGAARDVILADNVSSGQRQAERRVCRPEDGDAAQPMPPPPHRQPHHPVPLEVDTACGGKPELTAKLYGVVEDNHDGLEGEPTPFQGPERSRETRPR